MAGLESKTFDSPDEVREFQDHGRVELVNLDAGPVGKATFEPGWKWSADVKPIAGTDSCQAEHVGYCLSGRMKVVMDDGSERDIGPGEISYIPPGHDAWVVGDEACVMLDWAGMKDYAKSS